MAAMHQDVWTYSEVFCQNSASSSLYFILEPFWLNAIEDTAVKHTCLQLCNTQHCPEYEPHHQSTWGQCVKLPINKRMSRVFQNLLCGSSRASAHFQFSFQCLIQENASNEPQGCITPVLAVMDNKRKAILQVTSLQWVILYTWNLTVS